MGLGRMARLSKPFYSLVYLIYFVRNTVGSFMLSNDLQPEPICDFPRNGVTKSWRSNECPSKT